MRPFIVFYIDFTIGYRYITYSCMSYDFDERQGNERPARRAQPLLASDDLIVRHSTAATRLTPEARIGICASRSPGPVDVGLVQDTGSSRPALMVSTCTNDFKAPAAHGRPRRFCGLLGSLGRTVLCRKPWDSLLPFSTLSITRLGPVVGGNGCDRQHGHSRLAVGAAQSFSRPAARA